MNLNSRYAPIIALGVLGVVVVLMLGYFLAVKPQIDSAVRIASQTQDVEANTVQIEQASAKIDQFAELLAQDSGVAESIAVNAPSQVDVPAFRDRLWAALGASGVEVIDLNQANSVAVDGWVTDARFLVSTQVAGLFQTGPKAAGAAQPAPAATASTDGTSTTNASSGGWTPVVKPVTGENPVAANITMVTFTITVTGTPTESHNFFGAMSNPADQLFQVYSVTQEARQSDDSPIPGVSDPQDGNVITTITGALYFLGATGITDESSDGDVPVLGPVDGGFNEIGPAGTQPGA